MADFVAHHEDLSSDAGYQFLFHCDRCPASFTSTPIKTLKGEILRAAGRLVGGLTGGVSEAAFEMKKVAGDPEHDAAFARAVAEAKGQLRPCRQCGKWVCTKACYNAAASACEDCAPNPEEESLRSAAREVTERERTRQEADDRLYDKDQIERTLKAAEVLGRTCGKCGATGRRGKFCNACGGPLDAGPACASCGTANEAGARFCASCGTPVPGPA